MAPLDNGFQQVKQKLFIQIQAYSGIIRTLCNPDIFKTGEYPEPYISRNRSILRTLAQSQPWYIQNPGIFRTLVYSKSEAYSEPCQTFTMKCFAKIVNGYNYFIKYNYFRSISLPRSLLHKINTKNFFDTSLIFTPELAILCKKNMASEKAENREFLIYLLIYSNKLTYLQLGAVQVHGRIPPKSYEQGYLKFWQKRSKIV